MPSEVDLSQKRAWIVDDGELVQIRELLRELRIPFGEGAPKSELHSDLLISSPQKAIALESGKLPRPTCRAHLVIADLISKTVRSRLQRSRCDFLIQQPVHPVALRLLVLHVLYEGPERRRRDRTAMDAKVKLKRGFRSRSGTLIQLSPRGCGVIVDRSYELGDEISLVAPKSVTGGSAVPVPGHIVAQDAHADGGRLISIAFSTLSSNHKLAIQSWMEQAIGDGRLSPRTNAPPSEVPAPTATSPGSTPPAVEPSADPIEEIPSDRRRNRRAEYEQRVLASGDGRASALLGRDLSIAGMRVEPDPTLHEGDRLKLVLYGGSGVDPILVRAEVVRNAGDEGIVLHFSSLADDTRNRLAKLVDQLPVLEDLRNDGDGATGRIVVSEVVERERSEP